MKKCPSCGTEYEDAKGFCTKCGTKLVSTTPAFEPIDPRPDDKKFLDPSDWIGAALALVGLLILWFGEDIRFGIVAIVGLFYGRQSRNIFFRIAAYVFGGIALIITVLALLFSLAD